MTDELMRTRSEKKAASLEGFLRWLLAAAIEHNDVTAHNPAVLAAAWLAVEGVGLFKSTGPLPLPTVAQAEAYATAHRGCKAHVIDQDRVMLLDADGREVRQYKGKPCNVAEIPDEAYGDLPRLRRTKTPSDPHGRIVRSIGSLITAGREGLKAHYRALKKAKAQEEAEKKAQKEAEADAKAQEDGKPDKPKSKSKKGKKGKTQPPAPIEG